jgi:ribosomal protein L37AE/L43A
MEQRTMTYEEQEEARRERLAEVGTEPACPFCQRPRVRRSDYTRCDRCGVNWLDGEDLSKDPRNERKRAMLRTTGIGSTRPATSDGVSPAGSTSE